VQIPVAEFSGDPGDDVGEDHAVGDVGSVAASRTPLGENVQGRPGTRGRQGIGVDLLKLFVGLDSAVGETPEGDQLGHDQVDENPAAPVGKNRRGVEMNASVAQ